MKVLVTGAAGMLGTALVPEFERAGNIVIATDIVLGWRHLDVRQREQVKIAVDDIRPDLIVHLAAETDLEVCERDANNCWLTNALAVDQLAEIAHAKATPLVYVSTAGVFDGKKRGPYVESDIPSPINIYGESKLAGERGVQAHCQRYFIVRAGWMIGGGSADHKFVGQILRQITAGVREIYAVGDRRGSPTYNVDFARCLLKLIDTRAYGIYHMVCGGRPSRFDIAVHIINCLNRGDINLIKVNSSHFASRYPCPRPPSEWLRNLELERLGINGMRSWREALDEYLDSTFRHLCRTA